MVDHRSTLCRYSEFQPTGFDTRGLALEDQQDWLVAPVTLDRDSDLLTLSNWDAQLATLGVVDGADTDDCEIHRFGHWGYGWFEIAIVRPESAAHTAAVEIECSLADYPLLNENDHSERSYNSYNEQWESWGAQEFAKLIAREHDLSDLAEELLVYDTDTELLQSAFESAIPSGELYDISDGSPNVRYGAENISRSDVAGLIRVARQAKRDKAA